MAIQILVVDDEPQFERLLLQRFRRELRDGSYEFLFAENGRLALDTIGEHPDLDMVLTDINMPVMDGLTLLSKLKEIRPLLKGRALLNLLNNACYAVNLRQQQEGPDYRPEVKVSTYYNSENRLIEIHIQDNGPGIPTGIREKIFEPFYTTKPTGSGNTGLGLSITYDIIVNQHGGQLLVESEAGVFTRFTIQLNGDS